MDEKESQVEEFSLAIRILSNEILAFHVSSKSKRKSWIILSLFIILLLSILANQMIPLITLIRDIA